MDQHRQVESLKTNDASFAAATAILPLIWILIYSAVKVFALKDTNLLANEMLLCSVVASVPIMLAGFALTVKALNKTPQITATLIFSLTNWWMFFEGLYIIVDRGVIFPIGLGLGLGSIMMGLFFIGAGFMVLKGNLTLYRIHRSAWPNSR